MDARAYLSELSTTLLNRVRHADEREAGIGFAFGSQELRGAARALVDAGLLEPQAEREVLGEHDRQLRDRGHARPVSAAMWAQAGLRTQTPAAVVPSALATPSPVHLEAVIAVGAELGDAQGGTVTGLALELWTGELVFTYHVRAPLTA